MKSAPLEGIKVIEMARILAGPWAGQTLSDLGAEVIKLESPDGDDTRKWGPPFVEREGDVSAGYYHSCNRGKKSVVVDFRTPEGQQIVRDLVRNADVIIENFKVGGLSKYGLDYASLSAVNPRLIYCSVTGFGQTGPYAERAGYDYLMQGMGGLMSVTGEPDGAPQKVGVAVTDVMTGLYSVIAIQAALIQRQNTDQGQHIDMSLLDVATATMANQGMNYLVTGNSPKRAGNSHPNIAPYQVQEVADGYVIMAVGNDGQFAKFCDILGARDLADDDRFKTNPARVANREALNALLLQLTRKFSRNTLLAACEAQGVPAGPINEMHEVFADPHVQYRKMQIELDGLPSIRTPITFSGADLALNAPSPKLGEHTKQVLAALKR